MRAFAMTLATVAVVGFLFGSATAQGIPEWFPLTFTAELSGEGTADTGAITAVLTNGQLVVTGTLDTRRTLGGIAIFEAVAGESDARVDLTAVPGSFMNGDLIALPSPATGGAISAVFDLTDEQIADLKAGRWSVQFVDNRNRPGIRGRLAPVINLSRVEVDPEAQDISADAFPGVWIARGDSWGFQYYEDGTWTYLDSINEAGEVPSMGRNWRLRDNILIQDNGMAGTGTCSGHNAWYLERFEDGSLRMSQLLGPCGAAGDWFHYERVEP